MFLREFQFTVTVALAHCTGRVLPCVAVDIAVVQAKGPPENTRFFITSLYVPTHLTV
jgi:hypothetical protein